MVLPVRLPERVVLTRLVINCGVKVTEVVTGTDFLTIHLQVYADVLKVDLTIYPTHISLGPPCAILHIARTCIMLMFLYCSLA